MELNGFYTEVEFARWHVHYSFLSAFAHPASPLVLAAVYGRNTQSVHEDHYAAELVLLYVLTLARLELEAFDAMTERAPTVGLQGREEIRARTQQARALSAHLWFPTGPPHAFDRVEEANRRGVSSGGELVPWGDRPKPEDIPDDEVRYYENPLKRLINMHGGINELSGFQWPSPWFRGDALQRSID